MYVLLLIAAGGSVLLSESLEPNAMARNLLNTAWILAPYLVLMAVMVAERRTSLLATAVATLLGSVGALTSAVMMTAIDGGIADRFVPIYQAGSIAVLVPACRWITSKMDTKS